MKTHVPNRGGQVPLEPRTVPRSTSKQADIRSWLIVLLLLGMVVASVIAVVDRRRLSTEHDAAKNEWISTEADLRTTIGKQTDGISASARELALTRKRVSELSTDVTESKGRADSAEQRVAGLTEDLGGRIEELTEIRAVVAKSRNRLSRDLMECAANLAVDPKMAMGLLDHVSQLADDDQQLTRSIETLRSKLPVRHPIPAGSSVKVIRCVAEDNSVLVDVRLADSNGRHIAGLGRIDFEVFDAERRLHAVSCSERLLTFDHRDIVVVLDRSASTSGPASLAMREGASSLVQQLANPSRIKVLCFGDDVQELSPWTIDSAVHRQVIESIRPLGGTALYRALRQAVEDLQRSSGLRSIVLFTDGRDSTNSDSIDAVIERCRKSAVPVSIVALQTPQTDEVVLRRLATETGGSLHAIRDASDIPAEFQKVTESFQRPSYRLRILDSPSPASLTLRVSTLPPVKLQVTR